MLMRQGLKVVEEQEVVSSGSDLGDEEDSSLKPGKM
jgi:hypothetical protein